MLFEEKDLQTILSETPENLEDPETPEVPETPEEKVETPEETPVETPEEPTETPVETPETPEEPAPKTNSEFAAIRVQHREMLNQAKAAGYDDIETYMTHLREEASKASAEKNGVPEDFQKEFDDMKRKIIKIDEEEAQRKADAAAAEQTRIQEDMRTRLRNLQTEKGLDQTKLIEFGQKAQELGYPIGQEGFDLVRLYDFLNPPSQSEMEERIRQSILKEMNNPNAPSPTDMATPPPTNNRSLRELVSEAGDFFTKK